MKEDTQVIQEKDAAEKLSSPGERGRIRSIRAENGAALAGTYAVAGGDEVHAACEKAENATETYSQSTPQRRAVFLQRIGDHILALGDELISRCSLETGLPEQRIVGERGRTVNQLRHFAELLMEGSWVNARIDIANPERTPVPKPDVRSMLVPMGPVAVFGASNFPLAFSTAGGDTASALAAGNPVIVKAHPSHPGTSELVSKAILKAAGELDMPEGAFAHLHGNHETSRQLVLHPAIKAVGFTGSYQGGAALQALAQGREEPIPVYAEMGSINPVVILPSALGEKSEQIADALGASITLGVGQFCTNPGLLIVEKSTATDVFLEKLSLKIASFSPQTMLSQGIRRSFYAGVEYLMKHEEVSPMARSENGESADKEGAFKGGAFLFATEGKSFMSDKRLAEEVFGPSSLVVICDNNDEVMAVLRSLRGQLTATLYADEKDPLIHDIRRILVRKAGRVLFKGAPTGVEVCAGMVHGGPFPASSCEKHTSVGSQAIYRFVRPVCYQNFPNHLLPDELKDENPNHLLRMINGESTRNTIEGGTRCD